MLLTDGEGTPLSAFTVAANVAEVHTIETLVDERLTVRMAPRLLYDKAADADWLRDALDDRSVELITPHRKNRKQSPRQDGRSLRRYRRRYKVERSISWLFTLKRLLIRHEYHEHLFEGFLQLGCLFTILKWF